MKNGWTKVPSNHFELPWTLCAGRRMLWWISLEPHGPYLAKSFAIIGSLTQKHPQQEPYILDKENPACGFFYHTAVAYKEIGKGPNDE